jgi:hypothetical protein
MSLVPANIDQDAILRALNLNAKDPQTQALLLIAQKYELDVLLGHVFLVQNRPFISHPAQLHIAHRSGDFDGMSTEVKEFPDRWEATCTVWRASMGHPFTYTDTCSKSEQKVNDVRKRAVTRAERNCLKRAFDISLDVYDPDDAPPARTRAVPLRSEAVPLPDEQRPELAPVATAGVQVEQEEAGREVPRHDEGPPPAVGPLDSKAKALLARFREFGMPDDVRHAYTAWVTGNDGSVKTLSDEQAGQLHLTLHRLRKGGIGDDAPEEVRTWWAKTSL